MKIFLANYEPERIGGGWSWARNFAKVMQGNLSSYDDSDIYFITSASVVSREEVERAKKDGKKIALRIDNIIRNSRNRNTGMTRMKDFAQWADIVIYQSKFAADLLNNYLKPKNATIILNSVDQDIFNSKGREHHNNRYLYSKYSSDPTKNWDMARMAFQELKNADKTLTLVGRFDGGLEEYNFDFYQGEKINYLGLIDKPTDMAAIYKNCDVFLYSYFQDACSQTLIEALCCGLEVHDCYGMGRTGGAEEIVSKVYLDGLGINKEYFALPRMGGEYYGALAKL